MKSDKVDIKVFIKELLELASCKDIHVSGQDLHSQCPFHKPIHNSGRYSSFGISIAPENAGVYHCFSCHERGNIFTLIMFLYKVSFREAKRIFKHRVITQTINLEYIKNILSEMKKRKIGENEKIIKVDFPPRASDCLEMYEYLKWRNETRAHGILNIPFIVSRYELYYCNVGKFSRRIIMPLRSPSGEYVYFTNRAIDHWAKKNLFSLGSNASNWIYGLYEAIGQKKVIIVEGPFDLFQLKSFAISRKIEGYGFVAIMGTELQEERAIQLSEFFDEAYILFDADKEGIKSEWKAYNMLSNFMKVYKLTDRLCKGKDPGTCNEEQLEEIFRFSNVKRLLVQI